MVHSSLKLTKRMQLPWETVGGLAPFDLSSPPPPLKHKAFQSHLDDTQKSLFSERFVT